MLEGSVVCAARLVCALSSPPCVALFVVALLVSSSHLFFLFGFKRSYRGIKRYLLLVLPPSLCDDESSCFQFFRVSTHMFSTFSSFILRVFFHFFYYWTSALHSKPLQRVLLPASIILSLDKRFLALVFEREREREYIYIYMCVCV